MLYTNLITNEIKEDMIQNGYNLVDYNKKLILLRKATKNSMLHLLNVKDKTPFSLNDAVRMLDYKTTGEMANKMLFASYINSVINIASEIQGSVITWDQQESKSSEYVYDEYGFVRKYITPSSERPSKSMLRFINTMDKTIAKVNETASLEKRKVIR